jgi:hypothetical protein
MKNEQRGGCAALLVGVGAAEGVDNHAREEAQGGNKQHQNTVVNCAGGLCTRLRGLLIALGAGLSEKRRGNEQKAKDKKQGDNEARRQTRAFPCRLRARGENRVGMERSHEPS